MLTAKGIAAMQPGTWAADPAARGAGRLQVRKLAGDDVAWYYRYTTSTGARDRLPIGSGLTLAEARARAAQLSRRYQSGERDLRQSIDEQRRQELRARTAAATAAAAEDARQKATLGILLDAYVESLVRAEKASADAVGKSLHKHVKQAWPALWAMPAADVTTDHLLEVVARLVDAGTLREAGKVRSYLRAAYSAGIRARQSATASADLRALNLSFNPARDLATIEGGSKARQRALSVAELRAYWRRLRDVPGAPGGLLRFHLLTGGQRIAQLARLTVADLDVDLGTVRIRDGKGRRREPRMHDIPLLPAAAAALAVMRHGEAGEFLFTVSHGVEPATYDTLVYHLRPVIEAMATAGELERGPFTPGDLRRTIETRLAAVGIHKDDRAQLQSHGLGGVQDRHYDVHEYLTEKRVALEALLALLEGTAATVTPLQRARES